MTPKNAGRGDGWEGGSDCEACQGKHRAHTCGKKLLPGVPRGEAAQDCGPLVSQVMPKKAMPGEGGARDGQEHGEGGEGGGGGGGGGGGLTSRERQVLFRLDDIEQKKRETLDEIDEAQNKYASLHDKRTIAAKKAKKEGDVDA